MTDSDRTWPGAAALVVTYLGVPPVAVLHSSHSPAQAAGYAGVMALLLLAALLGPTGSQRLVALGAYAIGLLVTLRVLAALDLRMLRLIEGTKSSQETLLSLAGITLLTGYLALVAGALAWNMGLPRRRPQPPRA